MGLAGNEGTSKVLNNRSAQTNAEEAPEASDHVREDSRSIILSTLAQQPCVHKSELCRMTRIGWGAMGHHLGVLKGEGLILTRRYRGRVWIFPANLTKQNRDILMELTDPVRVAVYDLIKQQGETTITALTQEMDASRKVLRTHLTRLVDAGALDRKGARPHRYSVANSTRTGPSKQSNVGDVRR